MMGYKIKKHNGRETMSPHKAVITKNADGQFYALIVRVDRDGEESVIHGYKGRHFKTLMAAEKSTSNYIAKMS
jgi:demethoxyubiquinone hydroxylase (CLK1/Coq7/Cat5 family)